MITIAYHDGTPENEKQTLWAERLTARLKHIRLVPLSAPHAKDADIALVWRPPVGRLRQLNQLRLIVSLGQGVDHLFSDPHLPDNVPVVRLVDPDMSHALSHWVILALLDYLRDGPAYRLAAAERRFDSLPQRQTAQMPVAVYGLGAIGRVIAHRLAVLGFAVQGWSRRPRDLGRTIQTYHGEQGFQNIVSSCIAHICILPLTPHTTNLFSADVFAAMPAGSYFINAGRGHQVEEGALLNAIRTGHLAGAALDVFVEEPLPDTHPFWKETRIAIWPHVAAQTNPDTAADQVAQAISTVLAGGQPEHIVDKFRGY